jgi:hypothetical protein
LAFRTFAAALLLCAAIVSVAGTIEALQTLWYGVVDPVVPAKLVRATGTLERVVGECPSVRGRTVFTVRVKGQGELVFTLRCGRKLRNELAHAVGTQVAADYRMERDLLFWPRPTLYGLRSGDQVFVHPRESTAPVLAAVVSLMAACVGCMAAFYAVRGFKKVVFPGAREAA